LLLLGCLLVAPPFSILSDERLTLPLASFRRGVFIARAPLIFSPVLLPAALNALCFRLFIFSVVRLVFAPLLSLRFLARCLLSFVGLFFTALVCSLLALLLRPAFILRSQGPLP